MRRVHRAEAGGADEARAQRTPRGGALLHGFETSQAKTPDFGEARIVAPGLGRTWAIIRLSRAPAQQACCAARRRADPPENHPQGADLSCPRSTERRWPWGWPSRSPPAPPRPPT
ncbi:MAG: hypothetical protein KGL43_03860, partial [Burkholderiales bacterium]|nr:hypothetical protein [Burkholderiales bacterium]